MPTEGVIAYQCTRCQKSVAFAPRAGSSIHQAMGNNQTCFDCQFWIEKIGIKDRSNVVRADGGHYIIGDESETIKGFGGHEFIIQFNDGRRVTTTNLWFQGEIPPGFKEELPDNAVFLKR